MKTHNVTGGDGVRLRVREWGNQTGPPILFIHGWSQSHQCWMNQYESRLADAFRLVALDLRGHGMSEAPASADQYTDAEKWAEDVVAVIAERGLDHPVLVAWSYGGLVVCDYLRRYGTAKIAGVNFVGALVNLSESVFGTFVGPGFLDHVAGATAHDLPTNIEAIRAFVRGSTHKPLPPEMHETALCWNMVVSPEIRGALVAREVNSDEVLATLDAPVLMSHGRYDTIVLPAMGEHIVSTCPNASASWYPETGHAPFLENASRFNDELSRFVRDARAVCFAERAGS